MYENLDGAIAFYLLVDGGLTLIVGMLALAGSKRAVARNMKAADREPARLPSATVHRPRRPAATPLNIRILDVDSAGDPGLRSCASFQPLI